ncbi:DUF4347 domain-containing protein [Chlorobium phaeobacteroides]|uniref:Lipase, class 3 n=1 Tax=Chlorobium phaeobacteroides (strain DSM 266 / SMG 266 / 2430) TaxID=290317 RepID=A1BIU7_CHLPD|nr:DUF4347 domain-containing protein [Chlorobium phaeobacteroides]ABL66324.1 lipase, class 3 [Chlorobium phaeobacteroides DSM 266]
MAKSIVFIDSRIPDKEVLISCLSENTEYVILEADRDGLQQIAESLFSKSGYDSIQMFSHGSPGSITIGSTVLDNSSLTAYAEQLNAIGNSLSENGDLLLFGCNVAAGAEGKQFIESLSHMTGADVAASDDVTGSASSGGDWKLERQTGVIETAPAWSSEPAISGTLSTFSDDENYDLATFAQLAKLSRLSYETGGELNNQLQWIGWSLHGEARYHAFDVGAIYIDAHAICAVRNEDGRKEMTIAFQGSDLIDFVTTDIVGYGFSLYYRSVRAEVVAWLKEAVAEKYDAIYITGHSLGGAAAQIALLDIMGNQNQSIWTLSTVPLNTNDRITDAGLTSEELSYVRSHISGATFGAPDVRIDPSKYSAIYGFGILNDNVYDESWFKTHLYQFEHKSTGLDGDPVAALGGEIGQFVAIDLSEDIKDRYWGLNPIAFLHSMDAYNESMLRALTGSPLISSGSLDYGELIDSLSTNPSEGNDRIVLTQAKFNAQPLNDRLNAFAGNDILITNSTTPQSALIIGGDGHDTYIVHDSGVDIKISGPSGEHIDNLYFNQIGQISTYVNEDNLVVLITNYDESSRVEIVGWYSSEETYRIGQIGVIQPSDDYYWSFQNISLESLNIPLFREGLDYSDDVIVGLYAEDDIMNGYGGNDTMEGRGGDDEINPGGGNDTVDAGSGDDTVNMVAVYQYTQSDVLDGGSGTDTLNLDYTSEWYSYDYWSYYDGGFDYGIYDAEDTRTTLASGSSLNDIQTALSTAVKTVFDGQNTDVSVSNFEILNLKGSQTDNLLIFQMVGSYDGQGGTDTFYADWSGKSVAVNWINTGEAYIYEGVTVSNVERLLLQTGSGADVIDNTAFSTNDDVRTGAGNDTISVGWGNDYIDGGAGNDVLNPGGGNDTVDAGSGDDTVNMVAVYQYTQSDVLDGGSGTDTLNLDYTSEWYSYDYWSYYDGGFDYGIYDAEDTRTTLASGSSLNDIQTALSTAVKTVFDGQNTDVSVSNFEILNLKGSQTDNLLIFQMVGSYDGQGGTDTFYADWSGKSVAVNWINTGEAYIYEGVTVSNVERLLLQTGSGADVIDNTAFSTNDDVRTGAGNDTISVGWGNDYIDGGAGNDVLNPGGGNDTVDAGSGDDTVNMVAVYQYTQSDVLDGGSGTDTLNLDYTSEWYSYDYWSYYDGGFDYGIYDAEDTRTTLASGSSLNDIQTALSTAVKTVFDGQNTDVSVSNFEILNLKGSQTDNLLIFQMVGSYDGQGGTDTFYADWSGKSVAVNWINTGEAYIYEGVTVSNVERLLLQTGSGADVIDNTAFSTNDDVRTGAGNDTISVGWGNDYIDGGAGNDVLNPGGGNDTVDAGSGDDTVNMVAVYQYTQSDVLDGGSGTDTLNLDYTSEWYSYDYWSYYDGGFDYGIYDAEDTRTTLASGSSLNDIQTALSTAVKTVFDGQNTDVSVSNFEILNLKGSQTDNLLIFQMVGSYDGQGGTDTFYADWSGKSVAVNWINTGEAYIYEGVTVSNVERLLLQTGSGADVIDNTAFSTNDDVRTGAGDDALLGGAGNDILDGGSGADSMAGGIGDDTYVVNYSLDVVTENADEGTDLVKSSTSWTLGDHVEHLELTGTANTRGTGNELDNRITGNIGSNMLAGDAGKDTLLGGAGNDTLDGGTGADSMAGGIGDDTYVVDDILDVVTEYAGEGTDLVKSSTSWTLGDHVEHLELSGTANTRGTGNELDNRITGNIGSNMLAGDAGKDTLLGGAGNDALDGGSGADSMVGGIGDDTYVVNYSLDVVTENADEGIDLVQSSTGWTLGANVEHLELTGTANTRGTGNELDNRITGNSGKNTLVGGAGNDTLDGGSGADSMAGGEGDDVYVVNYSLDVVTENADEGIDLVQSSTGWTLGANVENLELTGTANTRGTGNDLDNRITGNSGKNTLIGGAGNDTLDGGSGADSMVGGIGDDTYVVNYSLDVVTENADEGIDLVQSSTGWTLGANVEHLELTGTANTRGTGNDLDNVITGNSGKNYLAGEEGEDILLGGAGADTLYGGMGADELTGGTGRDVFLYNNSSESGITEGAWDVITDFTAGFDRLDLSGIDANTGIAGNQSFSSDILGSGDAFSEAGQLRFDSGSGVLYGNTDGDADAEFAIKFTGIGSMSSSDIVL